MIYCIREAQGRDLVHPEDFLEWIEHLGNKHGLRDICEFKRPNGDVVGERLSLVRRRVRLGGCYGLIEMRWFEGCDAECANCGEHV